MTEETKKRRGMSLGVNAMLRRLGVIGESPDVPLLGSPDVQLVATVGDFSSWVSPNMIAPRALIADDVAAFAGRRASVAIMSLAPGGTLINRIGAHQTAGAFTTTARFEYLTAANFNGLTTGTATKLAVTPGSDRLVNTAEIGTSVWNGAFVTSLGVFSADAPATLDPPWWVPPGMGFIYQLNVTNQAANMEVEWTELQEPLTL